MERDSPDTMGETNGLPKNITKKHDGRCSLELIGRHKNRERGIVTKSDRDFLCRDKNADDTNPQTVRDRRYRIRKRIVNSIKDFDLLSHRLSSSDRGQIFQKLYNSERNFLKEVGVFLYLGFQDLGEKASKSEFLENVIETAEKRRGRNINARVESRGLSYNIEITNVPLSKEDRPFLEDMIQSAGKERGLDLNATVKSQTDYSCEVEITESSSSAGGSISSD